MDVKEELNFCENSKKKIMGGGEGRVGWGGGGVQDRCEQRSEKKMGGGWVRGGWGDQGRCNREVKFL